MKRRSSRGCNPARKLRVPGPVEASNASSEQNVADIKFKILAAYHAILGGTNKALAISSSFSQEI